MTTVVLNSGDVDAEVRDATGEGLTQEGEVTVATTAKEADNAGDTASTGADDKQDDLDKEGDDGLTNREKAELSAKMLKAVGKRVREKREAEEFAAEQYNLRLAAERQLKELQAGQPAAKTETPAAKAPPKRDDFQNDEEYIAALVNHGVESRLAEKQAEDAKKAAEQRQADIVANARAMIEKATDLVPDFIDVTSSVDLVVPPAVVGYMQESEMLAELGYYLAKNPDVIESLQKMRPDKQLVAIGKIEGRLLPFSKRAIAATDGKDGGKEKQDDAATTASNSSATATSTTSKPQSKTEQSQTGTVIPSAARKPAPVFTPISANGNSGEVSLENVRDHISEFARTRGVNLTRRQRH